MFARIKLADGRTAWIPTRSVDAIVDKLHGKTGCFVYVGPNDFESTMSAEEVETELIEARKHEIRIEMFARHETARMIGPG